MLEVTENVSRAGHRVVPKADTVLLAIAIVAGSAFLGTQLGAVAARPTEFAECAEFSADWFQRREGFSRPIPRAQLVAAIEKAQGLGEAEDAARLAGMLASRDDVVVSMCAPSN
jgi:hypothetical protein